MRAYTLSYFLHGASEYEPGAVVTPMPNGWARVEVVRHAPDGGGVTVPSGAWNVQLERMKHALPTSAREFSWHDQEGMRQYERAMQVARRFA